MLKNRVTVIGGGIAGMETAGQLSSMGFSVNLLEKGNRLGGHVADWHHLFPDYSSADEIVTQLKANVQNNVEVHFGTEVHKLSKQNGQFEINLTDGENLTADAVVVATGFDLFDARKKEEYGFGIYDNVITSAQLEEKLKSGKSIKTPSGIVPKRIAIIHCVGSRDEKAGNTYCSKVCCVTGVKQAIEIKKVLPTSEVFNFYMDLRMFDRFFEDLYYEAQTKYNVQFIRGRLSEACENIDKTIVIKAEDTLVGKPIKLTVDLVVLMVGFVPSRGTIDTALKLKLKKANDGFLQPADNHINTNSTSVDGIFMTGACGGAKSIAETIADARSAAINTASYLKKLQ
jgi:heterodisulfide reductase subunit A